MLNQFSRTQLLYGQDNMRRLAASRETPIRPPEDLSISCRQHCVCPPGTVRKCTRCRDIPGSTVFVPSAAGLIIAAEAVRDLTQERPQP